MAIFEKKLRAIANTIKDDFIKKYVLEYFLEKIAELTPHSNQNKKKFYVKKIKSLGKGKYGRILGIPYTKDDQDICQMLIKEGHAVEYWGGKKKAHVKKDGTWGE